MSLPRNALRVGRFYDAEAGRYDRVRWTSEGGLWIDRVQRRIVADLLGPATGRDIVDLATGTGRIGLFLAGRGHRVVGIDISRGMLREGQAKVERDKASLRLVRADGCHLPVRSGAFDACVCVNALSLMPDHAVVLREITRILKPGGTLICNFANLLSYYLPFAIAARLARAVSGSDVCSRWHRLAVLKRTLRQAGFEIEDVCGHVHLPRALNPRLFLPPIRALDRLSRASSLRYLCPSLFFRLRAA